MTCAKDQCVSSTSNCATHVTLHLWLHVVFSSTTQENNRIQRTGGWWASGQIDRIECRNELWQRPHRPCRLHIIVSFSYFYYDNIHEKKTIVPLRNAVVRVAMQSNIWLKRQFRYVTISKLTIDWLLRANGAESKAHVVGSRLNSTNVSSREYMRFEWIIAKLKKRYGYTHQQRHIAQQVPKSIKTKFYSKLHKNCVVLDRRVISLQLVVALSIDFQKLL